MNQHFLYDNSVDTLLRHVQDDVRDYVAIRTRDKHGMTDVKYNDTLDIIESLDDQTDNIVYSAIEC
jgi:hypothetical protein